jgi:glycosyltransferase involved in cell wall biosynthesis
VTLRCVLLLTYHFPPSSASGSFRLLGFARHLPRHGWRAAVVAPPGLPWEPTDAELSKRLPPETTVEHVPYRPGRLASRLAPFACWLPAAARACRKVIEVHRPEAVLTSGPPHLIHGLGLWAKRRFGLPWVADFRDPWFPEGRLERGSDLASRWVDTQERAVMRAADAVVANAPGACRALREAYPALREKFVTLPNGYDREDFAALAPVPRRPAGAPLRVVHTGAIYVGRDPRPVLDAVHLLDVAGQLPDAEVAFYGPPPEGGLDLAAEAAARGLSGRVEVGGQVPYDRALREMAGADVLLLMDTPGRTVGVPAKLYEYIGAGRPVLALGEAGGDLADVLGRGGVPHRIVPPGDAPAAAHALAELAAEARAPAPPARDVFSREAITGRLAALLDRCAGAAGQGGAHAVGCEAGSVEEVLA